MPRVENVFAAEADIAALRDARDAQLALAYTRREPQVLFEAVTPTAPPPEVLSERLLEFMYTDEDKEPPVVELTFRNDGFDLLQPDTLALGAAFRISFGYPDTNITRIFVLKKVRGAGRGASGDQVIYEGRPRDIDGLHRSASRSTARLPPFRDMRVSDAVREVADLHDFRGASALIEQTEPILAEIAFQEGESALQFVARMARRHNFTWGVHNSIFHFHSRGFRAPNAVTVRAGGPQVISLDLTGDFTVPTPSLVRSRGYDPRERVLHTWEIDATAGARETSTFVWERAGTEQALQLTGIEVVPTSDARNKSSLRAERRFLARAAKQWTLDLTLVGDPAILPRTVLDLHGYPAVLAGEWHVRGVKHSLSKSGYTTELSASRRAPTRVRSVAGGTWEVTPAGVRTVAAFRYVNVLGAVDHYSRRNSLPR